MLLRYHKNWFPSHVIGNEGVCVAGGGGVTGSEVSWIKDRLTLSAGYKCTCV